MLQLSCLGQTPLLCKSCPLPLPPAVPTPLWASVDLWKWNHWQPHPHRVWASASPGPASGLELAIGETGSRPEGGVREKTDACGKVNLMFFLPPQSLIILYTLEKQH